MNINNKTLIGHISCFTAYAIFGLNLIVCKDLANSHIISPFGLFCLRSLGATLLFWLLSLFLPSEKVDRKDLLKIFCASMLGLYLTQVSFLYAITKITPMDSSMLSALTPIYTMFIAAIALKEPLSWKKILGVVISFGGIIFLLFNSVSINGGVSNTQPMGVVLIIFNCLCFALYLGIFKPLISKYSVVTFMKWMFLFSMLASVPFGMKEFFSLDYAAMSSNYIKEVGFLIFFSTFIAYFLIPVGQKVLRPTVISMYSYVQPIIASVISISIGMDVISWQKIVAAVAVFAGVILVNKSRAASIG